MKNERQARILDLISKHEIKTQDDITARLQAEGFKVTQATVSRDLRELKLTKRTTPTGAYRYATSGSGERNVAVKLNNTMLDAITSVRYSMNNVVIKTYPGLAQAVASGIDALELDTVLGSVAGDVTVIIVSPDEESSAQICERFRKMLKGN